MHVNNIIVHQNISVKRLCRTKFNLRCFFYRKITPEPLIKQLKYFKIWRFWILEIFCYLKLDFLLHHAKGSLKRNCELGQISKVVSQALLCPKSRVGRIYE